jgi:uncharacterized protein DUF6941
MIKHVDTLFCDDVRFELFNKLSIIGLFGPETLIPQFPTLIPKFFIVIRFQTGLSEQVPSGRIEITVPGAKPIVREWNEVPKPISITAQMNRPRVVKYQYHNLVFGLASLQIMKAGTLSVTAKYGRRTMKVGQLVFAYAPELNARLNRASSARAKRNRKSR